MATTFNEDNTIEQMIFHLVECDMSIFVDALLDEVGNHRHFAFQFSLFCFEGGKVECSVEGCRENRDNRILLADQLINRRYEHRFDVLLRQVRGGALLISVKFVIALPDYTAVLAVGVPNL